MIRLPQRATRPGFTLVELLVVIAIMTILFGLTAAFLPAAFQRNNAFRGGQIVATTLAQARQKAKHDRVAVGVRFQTDPKSTFITKLTWVAQPDDITGNELNGLKLQSTRANKTKEKLENFVEILGGAGMDWQKVRSGDYLEIFGNGLPHRITDVQAPGGMRLASALPYPIPPTSEFRIRRQPVELPSEPEVKLPYRIAVDVLCCRVVANGDKDYKPPTMDLMPAFDIIFTPNGNVVGGTVGPSGYIFRDKTHILLCVRDMQVPPRDVPKGVGNSAAVGVTVETGVIRSAPIDPSFFQLLMSGDPGGL